MLLLSIYMAIIYGTLYMMFAASPIVYQQNRHWSEGIGGLAFLGVAFGMICAVIYTFPDNSRYQRCEAAGIARGEGGASTIPAFIALTCVPFPFLFYRYGLDVRKQYKFPREAAAVMAKIKQRQPEDESSQDEENDSRDPERKTELTMEPEAVEAARSDARGGDPKSWTRLQSLERDVGKAEV